MKLSELHEAKDLRTKNTAWVIVHTGDKIILGKRSPSVKNPNQWNFFGGHIDEGETAAGAAVRELYEETKLKISPSALKQVAQIGSSTYFSTRLAGSLSTTKEISAIKKYRLTDLPDNLHAKTQNFFSDLDALL